MRKVWIMICAFSILLLLGGCCFSHDWAEASCTAPKTCSKCAKTEGEPLGHRWEEATCAKPRTCAACGETNGAVLPHQFGNEEIQNTDYLKASVSFVKTCMNCGTQEERIESLKKLSDQKTFLLTPEAFSQRFTDMLTDIMLGKNTYFSFIDDEGKSDTLTMYMAQRTSGEHHKIVGTFKFTDSNNKPLRPEQKDEVNAFRKVQGTVTGENEAIFAMVALWLTGDPTNTLDEYRSIVMGLKAIGEEVDTFFLPKSKHITTKITPKRSSTYEFAISAN